MDRKKKETQNSNEKIDLEESMNMSMKRGRKTENRQKH